MDRPTLIALAALALTGCGQQGPEQASAPAPTPAQPATSQSAATPIPIAPTPPAPADVVKAGMVAALPAPWNEADLENGRRVFARCRSCHTITEGGPNMTGPNLHGVFGRQAGAHPGYNYSAAMKAADFVWDGARLDDWLENPRTFLQGNKMSFPGIPDAMDRRDVVAFLKVETGYTPTQP